MFGKQFTGLLFAISCCKPFGKSGRQEILLLLQIREVKEDGNDGRLSKAHCCTSNMRSDGGNGGKIDKLGFDINNKLLIVAGRDAIEVS